MGGRGRNILDISGFYTLTYNSFYLTDASSLTKIWNKRYAQMSFLPWHVLSSPERISLSLTCSCHVNSFMTYQFLYQSYILYLHIDKIVNWGKRHIYVYILVLWRWTFFSLTQCLGYRRQEEMFCEWAQLQVVESRRIIQEDFIYLFQHVLRNSARVPCYERTECHACPATPNLEKTNWRLEKNEPKLGLTLNSIKQYLILRENHWCFSWKIYCQIYIDMT